MAAVPKNEGPAFIPSAYREHDARTHQVQKVCGEYGALIADIDGGNHPLEAVRAVAEDIFGKSAWLIHSSSSSRPGARKWRMVIPLVAPVRFATWRAGQRLLHDALADAGIQPDRAAARAAQPVYLPNIPPIHARTGTLLREGGVAEGAPLYWERLHSPLDAPGLDLERGLLAVDIAALVAEDAARQAAAEAVAEEAARKRREGGGSTEIERFNAKHDLIDLMLKYEYADSPGNDADWRSPFQTTGTYATRVTTRADGSQYWHLMSASDAEAGLGREADSGGRHGDSFDLFVRFEHNGDMAAALAALRAAEAVGDFERVKMPPLPETDCREAQSSRNSRFTLSPFWAGDALPPAKPWLIWNTLPSLASARSSRHPWPARRFSALSLAVHSLNRSPFSGQPPVKPVGPCCSQPRA
jgi:hypothetical protein